VREFALSWKIAVAEVETPIFTNVPGGAAAGRSARTTKRSGSIFICGSAPELYLKRLLVGGSPKCSETKPIFGTKALTEHNRNSHARVYRAYADSKNAD